MKSDWAIAPQFNRHSCAAGQGMLRERLAFLDQHIIVGFINIWGRVVRPLGEME